MLQWKFSERQLLESVIHSCQTLFIIAVYSSTICTCSIINGESRNKVYQTFFITNKKFLTVSSPRNWRSWEPAVSWRTLGTRSFLMAARFPCRPSCSAVWETMPASKPFWCMDILMCSQHRRYGELQ